MYHSVLRTRVRCFRFRQVCQVSLALLYSVPPFLSRGFSGFGRVPETLSLSFCFTSIAHLLGLPARRVETVDGRDTHDFQIEQALLGRFVIFDRSTRAQQLCDFYYISMEGEWWLVY